MSGAARDDPVVSLLLQYGPVILLLVGALVLIAFGATRIYTNRHRVSVKRHGVTTSAVATNTIKQRRMS